MLTLNKVAAERLRRPEGGRENVGAARRLPQSVSSKPTPNQVCCVPVAPAELPLI